MVFSSAATDRSISSGEMCVWILNSSLGFPGLCKKKFQSITIESYNASNKISKVNIFHEKEINVEALKLFYVGF